MPDDWNDEDWPDDNNGSTEVVTCPACGADIYEDAPQCLRCGEFIVHNSDPWQGKPAWYILLAIAGIIAVVLVLSGLFGLW